MTAGGPGGQWWKDPTGLYELRWHDGTRWTEQVSSQGQTFVDPIPVVPFQPPVADAYIGPRPSPARAFAPWLVVAALVVLVGNGALFVLNLLERGFQQQRLAGTVRGAHHSTYGAIRWMPGVVVVAGLVFVVLDIVWLRKRRPKARLAQQGEAAVEPHLRKVTPYLYWATWVVAGVAVLAELLARSSNHVGMTLDDVVTYRTRLVVDHGARVVLLALWIALIARATSAQARRERTTESEVPSTARPSTAVVLGLVGLVAGVALAGVVLVNSTSRHHNHANDVTAATPLVPDRAAVVYSDNFRDSSSGWTTSTLSSGTRFSYGRGSYIVTGVGALHHFATAPFPQPIQQIEMSVTATPPTTAVPAGTGFGVACRTPGTSQSPDELSRYEFLVVTDGWWLVERRDGPVSGISGSVRVLQSGPSHVGGEGPVTVDAMCATLADGRTTRLAMFVNRMQVADLSDQSLNKSGWLGALTIATRDNDPVTFTVTQFEVRDLSRKPS